MRPNGTAHFTFGTPKALNAEMKRPIRRLRKEPCRLSTKIANYPSAGDQLKNLHPDAAGVSLPGGRHGLVQSQGPELEAVEHHGCRVLPLSADLPGKSPAGQWCEALKDALARYGPPEIFNSDQGSQFTSTDFTEVLLDAKVKISMDGRGRWPPSHRLQANDCRATDNRMIERLWRSLKYECVYLNAFETGSETRGGIGDWISYYNEKRPHSSHGLLTPAEAYDTQDTNLKAAA